MQARAAGQSVADEAVPLSRESTKLPPIKREWPVKLAKVLVFFILLVGGVLFGSVFNLHMSQYLKPSWSSLSSSPGEVPQEHRRLKLFDWLTGPSIHHNMTDKELLWLASLEPRRRGFPLKRVPKIAFMFLTKGPLPLAPLWERFFNGHQKFYSIYVHSPPGYKLEVSPSSVFHGRQIPSQTTQWGDITMCDGERRLLANALLDFANERFILLSETCIPLHSFQLIYSHLIFAQHSFVGAFDDPGPYGRGRYNAQMLPVVRIDQWRKGSQWFELNRKLAVYIVADELYYNKFRDFCKPACYVDEHYLPTMLSIEFGAEIANRSITWVDWSRGGPHPAMFGKDDITAEFIKNIHGYGNCSYNGHYIPVCFLFARKFSPNTLGPLLKVSSEIIGI
eukprot:c26962_g1_i2 orf=806-1984(+)